MIGSMTDVRPQDILSIIKKRVYIIVLILLMTVGCAYYYRTEIAKPVYEAKVSIIIGTLIDSATQQFQIDNIGTNQVYMQTYVMILKTNIVAERTISALGLDISADSFKKHYTAEPQPNTQFLEISVKWNDAEQAVAIADTISQVFMEEALRIYPTYTIKVLEKIGPRQVQQIGDSLFYLLSLSVGLILAFSIVLVLNFFDNTLKTEDDIERFLKEPVIGTIPKYKKDRKKFMDSIINNKNASMDAYRTLRTNLYYISKQTDLKSIVITSANPKEGKSTASLMLAVVLAQGGKKTLLIDCDLRKPSMHEAMNIENSGLSNILTGECNWTDLIKESKIDNLYVLPAGFKPVNPTELISSDAMRDLLSALKESFDYIVIDTPPVALVTDAQILSQFTEGYLIVVSSGESDKENTMKALKLIQYAQGKIIGVLLNKVPDLKVYKKYSHYYK